MHAKSVEITRLTIGFVDVCSDVVTDYIWLVVWNMAFTFPYIRNVIIPTDELIFFRGVGIPPTRFDGWIYFFFLQRGGTWYGFHIAGWKIVRLENMVQFTAQHGMV